jgi:glycerophosphoryl diester phosphodiesterase
MPGKHIYLLLIYGLFLSACKHDVPDTQHETTKIIGHRGYGLTQDDAEIRENTLRACKLGLSEFDGVEVDIQRSNDYAVFMFHDETVKKCDDNDIISIVSSTEPEIRKQFRCLFPKDSINTLDELLDLSDDHPGKDIFLDVKSFVNFKTLLKTPTPQEYMNLMSQDIFDRIKSLSDRSIINIETENAVMLNAFKKHYPTVNTWLTSFGDIETATRRAFKEHYTGISIKDGDHINQASIDELHENRSADLCVGGQRPEPHRRVERHEGGCDPDRPEVLITLLNNNLNVIRCNISTLTKSNPTAFF